MNDDTIEAILLADWYPGNFHALSTVIEIVKSHAVAEQSKVPTRGRILDTIDRLVERHELRCEGTDRWCRNSYDEWRRAVSDAKLVEIAAVPGATYDRYSKTITFSLLALRKLLMQSRHDRDVWIDAIHERMEAG